MAKIHLICGKICSGKTYYAKNLAKSENAVILSTDEVTYVLFDNNLGDRHDEMSYRIQKYLFKKAEEIAAKGMNVMLDWGFWTEDGREKATKYFTDRGMEIVWHYINISDEDWRKNIEKRNTLVMKGESDAYYLDEGLYNKLMSRFQIPDRNKIDIWYKNIVE